MTAVSVKVPREKLIAALQASLDKELGLPTREAWDEAKKANYVKWKEADGKWAVTVAKIIAKSNAEVEQLWTEYVRFRTSGLEFPSRPQQAQVTFSTQDQNKINQLRNAITLLNLSEEDFVNASTYKSVVQYL
jgi:hypothetical protein